MEVAASIEQPKILARCMAEGRKLELVQNSQGTVAILQDGHPMPGLDLSTAGVDAGVRAYMALLRHRGPLDA